MEHFWDQLKVKQKYAIKDSRKSSTLSNISCVSFSPKSCPPYSPSAVGGARGDLSVALISCESSRCPEVSSLDPSCTACWSSNSADVSRGIPGWTGDLADNTEPTTVGFWENRSVLESSGVYAGVSSIWGISGWCWCGFLYRRKKKRETRRLSSPIAPNDTPTPIPIFAPWDKPLELEVFAGMMLVDVVVPAVEPADEVVAVVVAWKT